MENTGILLQGIFCKNFYIKLFFSFFLILCVSCKVHSVEPEGLKFKRGYRGEHLRPDEYYYDSSPSESSLSVPHETSEITNENLCYTKSEKEGRCMTFRDCFPLLFVEDHLQNPGLAEILFQSAGNCNASTFEENIPQSQSQDAEKPFNKVNLRKQKVCCAGYKQALESQSQSTPSESQDTQYSHKGPGKAVSSKLPTIDPVESTIEEQGETSEENVKTNVHSDSKSASISNIELVLAEPAKSHAPEANKNHNHIKLPVLSDPQPIYDLSPWLCPGRHIFMPRGQWPWMVALLHDGKHFCSGTLIDKIHLLTSASCIYQLSAKDVSKVRVIIGDRVMYATTDGPHSWRKVVRITRHLQYNHQTLHNDIAILAMDSPIQYSPTVQPVNLPVTENRSHLSKAIVTGWSGVDIGKPYYDARPTKDSILELMDWRECHKIYDGFATGGITRDMLCTRTSNSSCVADLGSGLVSKTENCWHLIGITSFSLGCGNFPEVYTDVSRYIPWIQKNIKHYQYKSVHEILPPLAN